MKISKIIAAMLLVAAATVGIMQLSATPAQAGSDNCMGACIADGNGWRFCKSNCPPRG